MTPEQIKAALGTLKVRNPGGVAVTLTGYGAYSFAPGAELDLLDEAAPATIRAGEFSTAQRMTGYAPVLGKPRFTTYEIAQRIDAGDLDVVEIVYPDESAI